MDSSLWVVLFIATIIIFAFVFGWMVVMEFRAIHTLGERVENSLIASGWAGFSQLDLVKMGERLNLSSQEGRQIYLNKAAASSITRQYIIENLKLEDSLRASLDSYIHHRDQPVIIEEISIYNPDDLPVTTSDGATLERTTIHMIVLIPKDIKLIGTAYLRKSVLVDIDSFMTDDQL